MRRPRLYSAFGRATQHAIVSDADHAIVGQTLDGVITSWNAGATRLYGYASDEVIGRQASFLLEPDAPDELRTAHAAIEHGRAVPEFDTVRRHKSGNRLDVSLSFSPVRDRQGRVVGVSGIGTDISVRKRAERERLLLLSIIENSPDFVGIARLDGQLEYVNRAGQEMVGLAGNEAVRCTPFGDLFAKEERAWVERQVIPGVGNGGHLTGEVALRNLETGAAIPTEWDVFAVPAPGGDAPAYFACRARDISERKRAEDTVRVSEERFRAFMDHSPATAFIKDEDGRYQYVNKAWLRQFSAEPVDWHGKTDHDFWPRETADRIRASDIECLATDRVVETEEAVRTPAGEDRTWLVMTFPLGNGRRHVGGMAWDISDRKRAEGALVLRDRAIGAATQGLLITDTCQPDNPIVYASPGFERMTGYPAADVLGRNCRFLQGKDTDPAAVARVRSAISAGQPCTVELLNYRKDGTEFWNELSLSPVRDAADRLTHFVGVQADVSRRRSLEEQFRQAQKMEAIGQLAAGIAHDFNNLITVINGYSELLLQTITQDVPWRDMVKEIRMAGERSAGLTRQLLAFSRQQVLAPQMLDLNAVVGSTEKMLRRLIGEDVRLATTLDPELWTVRADPGLVEQVLMNLAVNARDAMPDGGRLSIETRNVERAGTHAPSTPSAPRVLLSVTDTGCGMTPEVMARIFEPFFTTKGPGKGTGLGLATVYGIVQQSGGTIEVASEVGSGTTFTVYLPPENPRGGAHKVRRELGAAPSGTETLLVVEDEHGVRALTRRILASCGYVVLEAATGDEAVRVASAHHGPIHLLVTDVVMPGAGGRTVAVRIAERYPDIRVLFMSGYTDDAVVRDGVLREGVNFLQKPFSPATLAIKVREVLDAPAVAPVEPSR